MIWFLYLALVTPLSSANTEYYHKFSKKIISLTGKHNSYFGYSIAYESQSKTLIVSAPLSNVVGDVFLCNIVKGSCDQVIQTNVSSICTGNKLYGKENMWLGAVVKSTPSYYVTCAPRCLKPESYLKENVITTEGHCFIGHSSNLMYPKHLKPIPDKNRYKSRFQRIEETMYSFGWSLDVFEKESIAITIGGPAMASGRLEKYSRSDDIPSYVKGDVGGVNFNFGYSVVSGYFIKNKDICYAVGSPYGTHGYGKVVFLSRGLVNQGDLVKDDDMVKSSEYRVGATYGSVLCTASFTGNMTDLLVGAPTYAAEHRQNTGAVYVYVRGRSNKPVNKRIIIGEHENSYFGSAIVSVGDLNNDQKDEFAIAAPYEADGRGTVYLYSGADVLMRGKTFRPLQIITPENDWRTFGLSLSSLTDYDDNGCNELAIGAPETDKVMLLRCMASVHVKVSIQVSDFNNSELHSSKPTRKESFIYEACLKVRYPQKPKDINGTIVMKSQIRHQVAKLKYPEQATYKVYLYEKKDKYCKTIEVLMPENGNYNLEIGIHVTASHIDDPIKQQMFDSSRVVLSDDSELESTVQVWAAECNRRCMPDLKYTKTEFSVPTEYVIGSSPNISATIWLENHGEVAYEACIHLRIYGASVHTAPSGCERKEDSSNYSWLKCSPTKLIRTNNTWWQPEVTSCGDNPGVSDFLDDGKDEEIDNLTLRPQSTNQIILDTTLLTNVDKEIKIEGVILNHCTDSSNMKLFNKTLYLVSDTKGVNVKGLTDFGTENNVNMTKSDMAVGKAFEHVYEISNNGPTTWVNIDFQVEVQILPFIEIFDVTIQINAGESKCKSEEIKRNENEYLIYKCKIEKLTKYPIVVVLPMQVKPGVVGDMIDKGKKITVYSELTFELQKDKKNASVTSIITKREPFVPLWVIISTAILGLIILTIIGLILREMGCLKRKNKDKLMRVRKSVRRQTVMRRQSQHERLERERMNSAEIQAMLAEAAKEQHDRRLRVPSTD